jgi:DnaK suppressor protein
MTTRTLAAPSEHRVTGRLDELREALIHRRDDRIRQIAELTAERSSDLADSQVHVFDAVRCAAIAGLADTEAALQRLAEGCYGRCKQCGSPIEPERLEVLPMALRCTSCQYAQEAAAWRGS